MLLLLLSWPPVRVVCPNHEVLVFQRQIGTAPYLGSVAIFTNILYFSHPTCFNHLWISHFPPRTWLISFPRIPPFNAASLSRFTRSSPPTHPGTERQSTWTDPPPTSLHCSSALTSLARIQHGVPRIIMCIPSLVWLPPIFHPWPDSRSLSAPLVIPSEGNFLPLPASVSCTSAPPPVSLYRRTCPLPVPKGLFLFLMSPVPCASSSPSPCSVLYICFLWGLISLRVWKIIFGCVCVISITELFWIVYLRSEAVVWIDIDSMGSRFNGNILVPHYNNSRRWHMTISHFIYKLFFSCSILFDQF